MLQKYQTGRQEIGEGSDVGHHQRVFAVRYHPDSNHVMVTGGWDNFLKVRLSRHIPVTVRHLELVHPNSYLGVWCDMNCWINKLAFSRSGTPEPKRVLLELYTDLIFVVTA